jgi:hypothetical protein
VYVLGIYACCFFFVWGSFSLRFGLGFSLLLLLQVSSFVSRERKIVALLLLLLGYYWQERKKERKFAMKFDCWSSLRRKLYEEAGVMSDNDLALSSRVLLLIHADCIDRQVKARPS